MQMEPGFNFSKEFPKLDKGLKIIGPYLAALVVAFIVMVIQGILPIHMIWVALLTLAQVDTLYRDHDQKKSHNGRVVVSKSNNPNVPFFDDPRQPTPSYRMKEDEDEPPPRESRCISLTRISVRSIRFWIRSCSA